MQISDLRKKLKSKSEFEIVIGLVAQNPEKNSKFLRNFNIWVNLSVGGPRLSSKGIEVVNCEKFNILFGKAMMIKKNLIHKHLGSFAAKISNQAKKRINQLKSILLSMQNSSGLKVAWLRVDKYHLINRLRGF